VASEGEEVVTNKKSSVTQESEDVKRERFQILINTTIADMDEAVERVLKDTEHPQEVLPSALSERLFEESIEGRGQLLATARLPPQVRREQLLRICGEAIVLLTLDEQRRGSDTIEKEMNAFFDGETKKEAS
jgi:hypothetical protein